MKCTITWNGDVYEVECPEPCNATLVLETFLGTHPGLRRPDLALFTIGGIEVLPYSAVEPGSDLVLRPRVIH